MKRNLLLVLSFVMLSFGVNAQVSIVGPGSPAGDWPPAGADIDLQASPDGLTWTLNNVTMLGGAFKFRWNHDWAVNWGGVGFPSGAGTQNGADIVGTSGTYDLTVVLSGADPTVAGGVTATWTFNGPPIPVVTLIGSATTSPVAFTTPDRIIYTASNVTLVDGTAQFDTDGVAFGGTDFPIGQVSDPGLFIPIPAGTYTSITFDNSTGDYVFTAAPSFPEIGIIGLSVGGWDDAHEFTMHTADGVNYYYYGLAVTSLEEGLKFRTNHDWSQPNYGGTGWPGGTASTDGAVGNILPTAVGGYDVSFNLTTLDYTFSVPLISLTGPAFTDWGIDTDLTTADNGVTYVANVTATSGDAKFRSNHDWIISYGGLDFPAGNATWDNGGNIPVVAGTYGVTFNHVTGAYTFGEPLATKSFNANGFKVYPNPTTNIWNFNSSSNEKINAVRIVDMLGKTVITVNADAAYAKVDASSLNSGIYFAKVSTASGETTVKLVKN